MDRQTESYLPGPAHREGFGAIDPLTAGTKVVNLAASYAAGAGAITLGIATGIGVALAIAVVVYSFVTAHQAEVKANRRAREARWQAFYDLGVGLITDVYGSIKDFEWSHAHDSDTGFGEYYSLGAMFYWWTGGTSNRDPTKTPEDFRSDVISYLISLGVEPTRFLGYENVALDESLDPQKDFIHKAEKKLTAKEILMGFGYTKEQLAAVTDDEPLIWIHDSFQVDLPNLSGSDQAQTFMNDMKISIKMLGLDPSTFENKVSTIASKGFSAGSPSTSSPLTASLGSSWGILMIGIAAAALFGIRKGKK